MYTDMGEGINSSSPKHLDHYWVRCAGPVIEIRSFFLMDRARDGSLRFHLRTETYPVSEKLSSFRILYDR
jgi:hypothetical protein